MADQSSIEWTEATWNPITGCNKVSPGCKFCYAERMAKRLQSMKQENYENGFRVTLHPHMLERPLKWRKPRLVFVNSMSDLFHEKVPSEFILSVFDVMRRANWHTFQVLTKRSDRLIELDSSIDWPANVWMGVSVENQDYLSRTNALKSCSSSVKFLSLEPLLGPLSNLNLEGIDWVIAGGESGPKARPINVNWVREIRDCCIRSQVPFFFKQWGGKNKKQAGRMLDGAIWNELPRGQKTGTVSVAT